MAPRWLEIARQKRWLPVGVALTVAGFLFAHWSGQGQCVHVGCGTGGVSLPITFPYEPMTDDACRTALHWLAVFAWSWVPSLYFGMWLLGLCLWAHSGSRGRTVLALSAFPLLALGAIAADVAGLIPPLVHEGPFARDFWGVTWMLRALTVASLVSLLAGGVAWVLRAESARARRPSESAQSPMP